MSRPASSTKWALGETGLCRNPVSKGCYQDTLWKKKFFQQKKKFQKTKVKVNKAQINKSHQGNKAELLILLVLLPGSKASPTMPSHRTFRDLHHKCKMGQQIKMLVINRQVGHCSSQGCPTGCGEKVCGNQERHVSITRELIFQELPESVFIYIYPFPNANNSILTPCKPNKTNLETGFSPRDLNVQLPP